MGVHFTSIFSPILTQIRIHYSTNISRMERGTPLALPRKVKKIPPTGQTVGRFELLLIPKQLYVRWFIVTKRRSCIMYVTRIISVFTLVVKKLTSGSLNDWPLSKGFRDIRRKTTEQTCLEGHLSVFCALRSPSWHLTTWAWPPRFCS